MWHTTEEETVSYSPKHVIPTHSVWITPIDVNFFIKSKVVTFHGRNQHHKNLRKWSPIDLPLQPQKD